MSDSSIIENLSEGVLTAFFGSFLGAAVGKDLAGITVNLLSSGIEKIGAKTFETITQDRTNHDIQKLASASLYASINDVLSENNDIGGKVTWRGSQKKALSELREYAKSQFMSDTEIAGRIVAATMVGLPAEVENSVKQMIQPFLEQKDTIDKERLSEQISKRFFINFNELYKSEKHEKGRLAIERDIARSLRQALDSQKNEILKFKEQQHENFDLIMQKLSTIESCGLMNWEPRFDSIAEAIDEQSARIRQHVSEEFARDRLSRSQDKRMTIADADRSASEGDYQRGAEIAHSVAMSKDSTDSEKTFAFTRSARYWFLAITRQVLHPGMHPDVAMTKFKQAVHQACAEGCNTKELKYVAVMEAMLDDRVEDVIKKAEILISEDPPDQYYTPDAYLAKSEGLARLGKLEEGVKCLTDLIDINLPKDKNDWYVRALSLRIKLLSWIVMSGVQVEKSFIKLILDHKNYADGCETGLELLKLEVDNYSKHIMTLVTSDRSKRAAISDMLTMLSSDFTEQYQRCKAADQEQLGIGMMTLSTIMIELEFAVKSEDGDVLAMAEIAYDIAERYANYGQEESALKYLGKAENYLKTSKDQEVKIDRSPWSWLMARGLACRGRTLYRLSNKTLEKQKRDRQIKEAELAFRQARTTATSHQEEFRGDGDLFCGEMDYWLGECRFSVGDFESAVKLFDDVRSTTNMANPHFASRVGAQSWFRQGEALLCLGKKDLAVEIFQEIADSKISREELKTKAKAKLFYISIGWPIEDLGGNDL
jgi:tetratricopeptide (TPR) repeat protein